MIDKKLVQRKIELEQDLSKSMIINDIGAIHSIYFDLPLLQDVYVGSLLLHTKNELEYNNILARLPYYQVRIDNDICKYFPTELTDEKLYSFMKNPKYGELIFRASPHTSLWMILKKFIGIIINKNRVVDSQGFHCDIMINTYKVAFPNWVYKWISLRLKQISKNLTLKTVSLPFEELPQMVRLSPDAYFLEDISVLFATDSKLVEEVYRDKKYDNKYIFAKSIISIDTDTPIEEVFAKTKAFCNIFTNFDYLNPIIPGVQYLPPVADETNSVIDFELK